MPFLGGRGQASRGYFGGGTTPNAPTALVSTKGNGQISVAFTAPVFDGGLPITTYQYALSTDSYATFTTRATGTTASPLVITGLTNGTSYGVKIRAVNSLGNGLTSDAATAVTPSTVPNAPTITNSPSHVNGQVTVTWNALTGADTGGAAILSYTLQHSASSDFSTGVVTVTGIASTSHPVSGLTNGTTRYFKVLGVNFNGDGAYSATASAVPSTVPDAPATPTVNALDAGDTITWTAPYNGGRAITGYYYKVSTNNGAYSGETFVAAGATLSYAALNQYSAGTKKIQVRAVNDNGSSGLSTVSANTVVWVSESGTVAHETACTTAACTCPACPACPCPACAACNCGGTSTITGSKNVTGNTGASTLTASNTNTRTCYRWARAGSTASGYAYNQDTTDACDSAYTGCTGRTCSSCTPDTCGCENGTPACGCTACPGPTTITTAGTYNGAYYSLTATYGIGNVLTRYSFGEDGCLCNEQSYFDITLCSGVYTITRGTYNGGCANTTAVCK